VSFIDAKFAMERSRAVVKTISSVDRGTSVEDCRIVLIFPAMPSICSAASVPASGAMRLQMCHIPAVLQLKRLALDIVDQGSPQFLHQELLFLS
jgi:hypothetical protein